MNWRAYLLLCAIGLTTSCTPWSASTKPAVETTPAECRVTCSQPPKPYRPSRSWAADMLRWANECQATQEKCVAAINHEEE